MSIAFSNTPQWPQSNSISPYTARHPGSCAEGGGGGCWSRERGGAWAGGVDGVGGGEGAECVQCVRCRASCAQPRGGATVKTGLQAQPDDCCTPAALARRARARTQWPARPSESSKAPYTGTRWPLATGRPHPLDRRPTHTHTRAPNTNTRAVARARLQLGRAGDGRALLRRHGGRPVEEPHKAAALLNLPGRGSMRVRVERVRGGLVKRRALCGR